MSRVPAVILSVTLLVAFCCCAVPARAEPIRVTSGFVAAGFNPVGTPLDAEDLQISGAGFSIGSSLEDEVAFVQLASVPTLADGAFADLSGMLFVGDVLGAQLNGAFTLVAAPFTMAFVASPTRLSCRDNGSATDCTLVAPFTFSADLTFTPPGGSPVTHHLIGGGTAEGSLFRRGSTEAEAVRYTFEASATPEPATLSSFTTGVFMVGAALWRRRRGCRTTAESFAAN